MAGRLALAGAVALSVVLVGAAGCSERTLTGRYLVSAAGVLEVLDATGRVERVLARDGESSRFQGQRWSPDGSMIGWIGADGLTVERADAPSQPRVLVRPAAHCSIICGPLSFVWSPDGRELLVGGAGYPGGLVSVSVEGGRARSLAPVHAGNYYTAIGWAQGEIVYTRDSEVAEPCCTPQLELVVARPDGTKRRTLFSFADGGVHDFPAAALSPDGRYLAFTSDGRSPPDPHLGVIDVGRGTMLAIHGVNPMVVPPVWSPDSSRLAFTGYQVVTLAVDGSRRRAVASMGYPLAWDRTGLTIVRYGNGSTLVSRSDGRHAARLLFRMPKNQAIVSIAVK